jgi:hypothetical protein
LHARRIRSRQTRARSEVAGRHFDERQISVRERQSLTMTRIGAQRHVTTSAASTVAL